jgi:hypothetical protein
MATSSIARPALLPASTAALLRAALTVTRCPRAARMPARSTMAGRMSSSSNPPGDGVQLPLFSMHGTEALRYIPLSVSPYSARICSPATPTTNPVSSTPLVGRAPPHPSSYPRVPCHQHGPAYIPAVRRPISTKAPTRAIARRTDLTSMGRCRIMHLCQRVGGELAVDFLWCLKDPVVPPTAVGVRPSPNAGLGRRRAHRRQSRAGRTLRSPAHPRAAISPAMCCCSTPAGGDNKPVPLDTCKIVSGG